MFQIKAFSVCLAKLSYRAWPRAKLQKQTDSASGAKKCSSQTSEVAEKVFNWMGWRKEGGNLKFRETSRDAEVEPRPELS